MLTERRSASVPKFSKLTKQGADVTTTCSVESADEIQQNFSVDFRHFEFVFPICCYLLTHEKKKHYWNFFMRIPLACSWYVCSLVDQLINPPCSGLNMCDPGQVNQQSMQWRRLESTVVRVVMRNRLWRMRGRWAADNNFTHFSRSVSVDKRVVWLMGFRSNRFLSKTAKNVP